MKPPTIQIDRALPGLPHKESFGHKAKAKVKSFFHLRPSHSRTPSLSRPEGRKSHESLTAETNKGDAGGSVGKNDMGECIECTNQTLSESMGKVGDVAGPVNEYIMGIKPIDKVTVQTAIKESENQVRVLHTLGAGLQTGTAYGVQANTVLDKVDIVSNILKPLKVFNSVVKNLGDLHPYAKIALSTLSWASQVIIMQACRDNSVKALQSKISEVYKFMIEDGQLEKIVSNKDILSQTSQVILECAKFIQSYSRPDFLKRLGKNIFSDTDEAVGSYNKALDRLMEQFHRNAMHDVLITTHDVLEDLKQQGDNQHISGIAYADGAGLDTTKSCLDGTREEILHEVVDWINDADPDAPRILWLSGPAGTGKSAIVHTIARITKDSGTLGSCFCFKKGDVNRYMKMIPTISRDLASRNLVLKQALAHTVASDPSISTTPDVRQQWDKLIMEPVSIISGDIVGRCVIVIDALDESGDDNSREHILALLANEAAALPANIRILITSRPLSDIGKALKGVDHVKCKSMDDIPLSSTEHDIQAYVSYQLRYVEDTFSADEIVKLAKRSDGLFEYARLACNYIKSTKAGLSAKERFDDLMLRTEKGGKELLDDMYKVILKTVMGEIPDERVLIRFRSVMRHVLFTLEPLPLDALLIMHRTNQTERGQYDAESMILRPMSSLLSGVYDRSMPIRPLHSSFHDFLLDRERSGNFFVAEADAHLDLALASLNIMRRELQFNICRLESSYMRNSDISDLPEKIRQYISPQLSYSCRFLANHIGGIIFECHVADMLCALLCNEQTLFWIETLGILKAINALPRSLLVIAGWLEDKESYKTVAESVKDIIQLVQNFGSVIVESTPHFYVSVLPFLPQESILSKDFCSKFPFIAKLTSGKPTDWTPVEFVLKGHTDTVRSVAFSPDGKYAATGSFDKTLRVWDTEVGLLVGRPLKGHNDRVNSIAFSPDGRQITSGSDDGSIRIWDIITGSLVMEPIEGHTDCVTSVAFSPDGKRIVSGSNDNTLCIWNVGTGQKIGKNFQGHLGTVLCVAFSPNGKKIISSSADRTICVWDVITGLQVVDPLKGHTGSVWTVAFSPDGTKIVSGSEDNSICIWDADTGLQLHSPLRCHIGPVYSVCTNGNWILSGSGDGAVQLWDIVTMKSVLNSPFKPPGQAITAISMSKDGKKFASGSSDSRAYVGDIRILQTGNYWLGHRPHSQRITSISYSHDSKQVISGSDDCSICIWDAKTGALMHGPLQCHSAGVLSVAFSPDGEKIASGSRDQTICIWDTKTGLQFGSPLKGHIGEINEVVFSPDGKQIASCSDDKSICIWDINTGLQNRKTIEGHKGAVSSIAYSPDGERIVSGSADRTVCIWDIKTGMQVGSTLIGHTDSLCGVAFSPDGEHIVSCSFDKTICIWDANTGLLVGTPLTGHMDWVTSVAFSPEGKNIVSSGLDQTIRIWDTQTGMEVCSPLRGHTRSVREVTFSPDGSQIASCGGDVTIRVWDVEPDYRNYKDVNLSPKVEHTLCNAADFFNGTTVSAENWRDCVYLNDEGWIVGPEGRLLLWIPVQLRKLIYTPRTRLILPGPAIELDLGKMAHGKRWMKCFDSGN